MKIKEKDIKKTKSTTKNNKKKAVSKKQQSFISKLIEVLLIKLKEFLNKESYIKGICGSIIGVTLASLPLFLVYIYGYLLSAPLCIIISYCAVIGYQEFKGPVNNKSPWIVGSIIILATIIGITIIMPLSFLHYEGYEVSLSNLDLIYSINKIKILKYAIVSVIFTTIGIIDVVKSLIK